MIEPFIIKTTFKPIQYKEIAVIASSYRSFTFFCEQKMLDFENGNEKYSGCEFIYCDRPENILGRRFDDYIEFGDFYHHPVENYNEIFMLVKSNLKKYYR